MKVFIVEDSPVIRERLVEMVETANGHTVVGQADSFDDAVAGIAQTRPDVAIFDIKLADGNGNGNGIEALAAAKRHMPGLLAIVMSNYATPQHRKASADAGAEYFLDKSADFERIPGILSALEAGQKRGPS
jgi:DNA-binding NarL/FixJ family response regulator